MSTTNSSRLRPYTGARFGSRLVPPSFSPPLVLLGAVRREGRSGSRWKSSSALGLARPGTAANSGQSLRNAISGSTVLARRAGTYAAASATSTKPIVTAPRTTGSCGLTS